MTPTRVGLMPTLPITISASSDNKAASITNAADERSAGTRIGQAFSDLTRWMPTRLSLRYRYAPIAFIMRSV